MPISVRFCDGISEKRFTQRDRTRGDGLAEISLENSTIAHLPALIRSPPMVLWLIEWGIFNFRSTLPLAPLPHPCSPPVPDVTPIATHTRVHPPHSFVCSPTTPRLHAHSHLLAPPKPPFSAANPPYLLFSNKASYYGITPFATRHNVRFLRDITPCLLPSTTLSFLLVSAAGCFYPLLCLSLTIRRVARSLSSITFNQRVILEINFSLCSRLHERLTFR